MAKCEYQLRMTYTIITANLDRAGASPAPTAIIFLIDCPPAMSNMIFSSGGPGVFAREDMMTIILASGRLAPTRK